MPLEDALRACADPDLVAAYDAALRLVEALPRRRSWIKGGLSPRDPRHQWIEDRRRRACAAQAAARRALEQDLLARLQRGELVATAVVAPERLGSLRKTIPAQRWRTLRPNFAKSSARGPRSETGARLELFDILVHRSDAVARSELAEQGRGPPTPVAAPPPARGRPSVMDRIRAEFLRRNAAGRLSANRSANARDLYQWAVEHLTDQGVEIPKVESIQRRIRDLYKKPDPDK